ncbi:MAG: tetratricopeptide repeat protein, partial [Alphaproteobacteria bacterium]|nr:tetratricopeptide repeat protein [Alphaproteobacteria bacterium]
MQSDLALAKQFYLAGRLPEADRLCREVLRGDPDQFEALFLLSAIARKTKDNHAAVDLLSRAIGVSPNHPGAQNNLGNALYDLGRAEEAASCFNRALAVKPDYAQAHFNLGRALKITSGLEAAVASYRRALAIKPDYPQALNNLGNALQELGHTDEAIECLGRAVTVKPDYAQAHYNLGTALKGIGRLGEAVASYRRALAIKPDFAKALNNLGTALQDLDELDEAVAILDQALAIQPDYAEAHNNLGNVLKDLGRMEEAVARYRRALTIDPDLVIAHSNLLFALHYAPMDPDQLLAEHLAWDQVQGGQRRAPADSETARDPDRRLRVGFVSADFHIHSVSYFLEAPLAAYDAERLAITCYANSQTEDETTTRLKASVDQWRTIAGMTDEQVVEAIQADEIDVLVDLSGHTRGNRLTVFAAKPAPVQVTWLGYPDTTGLSAIDYRLSDAIADPSGDADVYCVERLIRLPNGFLCYRPPDDAPEVGPLPMTDRGHVTFASFNNLAKVTPQVIESWARILQAVPGSRLLFKNKSLAASSARERYAGLFAEHG